MVPTQAVSDQDRRCSRSALRPSIAPVGRLAPWSLSFAGCGGDWIKEDGLMTGKADFSTEEWETISEAPATAGLLVMTAQRGGVFRETLAIAKAYTEARQTHGQSTLLDELVSSKPRMDHTRYHSPEELKQAGLGHLRDAIQ